MNNLTFYGGVKEIGAQTLYPAYPEHPDLYKKISKNVNLIQEGQKYVLSE